jgi:hypothetical protein
MAHCLAVALCAASVFATAAPAQISSSAIEPIRVPAGTVLAFHLQTRLRHSTADPLDVLPQGTVLHVRVLSSIDSGVDRDGSEFRGTVVSDLAVGEGVVIHSDAEVQGLLVLLRNRNHPEGFRYELLLTQLTDHGKSYPLTASLSASFFDSGPESISSTKVEAKEPLKPGATSIVRSPLNAPR